MLFCFGKIEQMSIIKSHLNPEPYNLIDSGKKTIEVRVNDQKRRQIKVGDELHFINRSDEAKVLKTEAVALYVYPSFDELFSAHPPESFGAASKNELLEAVYRYYTPEQETKYGVVGIELNVRTWQKHKQYDIILYMCRCN